MDGNKIKNKRVLLWINNSFVYLKAEENNKDHLDNSMAWRGILSIIFVGINLLTCLKMGMRMSIIMILRRK